MLTMDTVLINRKDKENRRRKKRLNQHAGRVISHAHKRGVHTFIYVKDVPMTRTTK